MKNYELMMNLVFFMVAVYHSVGILQLHSEIAKDRFKTGTIKFWIEL